MCRSLVEGGRRCPGCGDPRRRTLANVRQRISRNERAARAATQAQQWDRVERHVELLDQACADHEALTAEQPLPPPPTRAAEFAPEAAANLSDAELVAAVADCAADPQALDAIMARLEERETEEQRAAERNRERADAADWQAAHATESPLVDPVKRTSRKLTPDQQCRESYDSYVFEQWLTAEEDCRGVLLNKRGQAAGVDPVTLFEGPAHIARAYASEELVQWWSRNGRCTYREWRWNWFGRASDREAAATARRQDVGEAPA